jgi:hypothetical protein
MLKLLLSLFLCTPCFAQVIYGPTPEQRETGVYKSVYIIRTYPDAPAEVVKEQPTSDGEITVTTCVETDNGCEPSRHFITTITERDV